MKIAVIGAGPSGLVTLKELLAEGHQVVCYEKSADIGGLFRFDPEGVGVYQSTQMTSSAFISCFSDFPPPKGTPAFFSHTEYVDYLNHYMDHFNLRLHIQFKKTIQNISRAKHNKWRVDILNHSNRDEEEHLFDAVAVCSGVNQTPYIPNIPNAADFKGQVTHSGYYKNPSGYVNQRVLIVGGGESGSDLAREISQVSRTCAVSLRRGLYIIPRLIVGFPNDYYTDRFLYSMPNWIGRRSHPKGKIFLLRCILALLSIPLLCLVCAALVIALLGLLQMYQLLFQKFEVFTLVMTLLLLAVGAYKLVRLLITDSNFANAELIQELRKESRAGQAEQFAVKTEGLASAVNSGNCVIKPEISCFTKTGVKFKDGTDYAMDQVLFCTGYRSSFPFLSENLSDARKLYKNCFHSEYGSSLCFIGIVRPGLGAVAPVAEMQARWFAQICSKKVDLPSAEQILADIQNDEAQHLERFKVVSDRIPYLVDYTSYTDILAKMVGCKPRYSDLIKNPFLFIKVCAVPFSGYQYRLSGPHSKPDIAMAALKNCPRMYLKAFAQFFVLIPYFISLLLFKIGFKDFKPHLRLD